MTAKNIQIGMNREKVINHLMQDKFNLLREANEGFSKLLVMLKSENLDTPQSVGIVTENIKTLMSYHKLCPNRVLDLILAFY